VHAVNIVTAFEWQCCTSNQTAIQWTEQSLSAQPADLQLPLTPIWVLTDPAILMAPLWCMHAADTTSYLLLPYDTCLTNCCCCACTAVRPVPTVVVMVLQPIVQWGFIPAIIVAGMMFTKPRPTLQQLVLLG
jgi:hypothetical protein